LLIFSFLFSLTAYSQKITLTAASADCQGAIEIQDSIVVAENSPDGFGKIFEYPTASYDPTNPDYEGEHNSVWYKFTAPSNCILTLDIIPFSVLDDYDFIIYKYSGNEKEFCMNIMNRKLKPERMIISQNDTTIGSKTGLAYNHAKHDIPPGPGDSYGESLPVKKGEIYYFEVDNVKKGKGHTFILHFIKEEVKNISFENIYFKSDKAEFLGSSAPALDSLCLTMKNNQDLKIEISGHVNWPYNFPAKKDISGLQKLSEDRAKAVYNYLIQKGISADRITYKGFANSKMIYPNSTNDAEQSKNRRAEIKLLSE
jgi:outer membrane protein OmpA-like peptidoglycan-associated protein